MKKDVVFLGDTLKQIRALPGDVKNDLGFQIDKLQDGEQPDDFKPMYGIGIGVEEIRVWDRSGTYRLIYTARRPEAIYVLHVFQKTSEQTLQRDLELAKRRYHQIPRS